MLICSMLHGMLVSHCFLFVGHPNSKEKEPIVHQYIIVSSKICIVFVVFSLFFWIYRTKYIPPDFNGFAPALTKGMQIPSHLWYLQDLFGIYLFMPILKKVVEDKKLSRYYLLCWVFYSCFLSDIIWAISRFDTGLGNDIAVILKSFQSKEFISYSGYLVLGYYIYYFQERWVSAFYIAVALIACTFTPAAFNYTLNAGFGNYEQIVWSYSSFSALIQTSCYILICKQYLSKLNLSDTAKNVVKSLSGCTFGIYLVHPVFTEALMPQLISNHIAFIIPALTIIAFLLSLGTVYFAKLLSLLFHNLHMQFATKNK